MPTKQYVIHGHLYQMISGPKSLVHFVAASLGCQGNSATRGLHVLEQGN